MDIRVKSGIIGHLSIFIIKSTIHFPIQLRAFSRTITYLIAVAMHYFSKEQKHAKKHGTSTDVR